MSPKKPAVLASVLTELLLGPVSHLRNTVQSQLASAVTTKHPRHRNRKFERLLEPNPNDGERFFFEDIFHVVSFFKYAAGPGEKL